MIPRRSRAERVLGFENQHAAREEGPHRLVRAQTLPLRNPVAVASDTPEIDVATFAEKHVTEGIVGPDDGDSREPPLPDGAPRHLCPLLKREEVTVALCLVYSDHHHEFVALGGNPADHRQVAERHRVCGEREEAAGVAGHQGSSMTFRSSPASTPAAAITQAAG